MKRVTATLTFVLFASAAWASEMKVPTYTGSSLAPGQFLNVPVSISGASDVVAFQAVLHYDQNVLQYQGFTISSWFSDNNPYLVQTSLAGPEPFYNVATESFDGCVVNIGGYRLSNVGISVGNTTSQVVVTIQFKVLASGSSYLDLVQETTDVSGCALINSAFNSLSLSLVDGSFSNIVAIHDLAVSSVISSASTVTQGQIVTVSVGVANQGNQAESFTVSVFANGSLLGTVAGSLVAGNSATISHEWTTSAAGSYTISASVSTVTGETDTADNAMTGGVVTVLVAPIHDLAVQSVTVSPSSLELGGSATITVAVANQGNQNENATVTVKANGTTIGSLPVSLAPGASTSGSVSYTPAAAGSYSIVAAVPADDDASDNSASAALSVSAPPVYDIAITAFTASPTTVVQGLPVTLSITFSNQGNTTVTLPSWFVTVADWEIAAGSGGASLAPGASLTLTAEWTGGSFTGNVNPVAFVLPLTGELEPDWADNTATAPTITILAPVHDGALLAVNASALSANQGDSIALSATVANQGNLSDSFSVTFQANGVAVGSANLTLAPGASGTVNVSWNTNNFVAGTWAIEASLAPVAGETDVTDNAMSGPTVTLAGTVWADLADLGGRKAWPEHHHYKISGDEDAYQTLFAKVQNYGSNPVYVKVVFQVFVNDQLVGTYESNAAYLLATGMTAVVSYQFAAATSDYKVEAKARYSSSADGPWTEGTMMKKFGFAIVP